MNGVFLFSLEKYAKKNKKKKFPFWAQERDPIPIVM
jgi:hypothetical protein